MNDARKITLRTVVPKCCYGVLRGFKSAAVCDCYVPNGLVGLVLSNIFCFLYSSISPQVRLFEVGENNSFVSCIIQKM